MNTDESWPGFDEAWARVRRMQTKLHRWAIQDSDRVFEDLYNLVCDPAFLVHAWERVHGNKGGRTAGVDRVVPRSLPKGSTALLSTVRAQLKDRSFRPLPVRERVIPKPGRPGQARRLGIPTAADRIVQASLKLVLEPIFEADFQPCSYGFRPQRRAQDAIAEIHHFTTQGYEWVLEADIEACFDRIDHTALLGRIRRRVGDKRVLALIKAFLKAGVLTEEGLDRDTHTGTPQGGILSPLLANIALSMLDNHYQNKWNAFAIGTKFPGQRRQRLHRRGGATYRLVRYADDFVVLVHGQHQHAAAAQAEVAQLLRPMGLTLSAHKTRVVHIEAGFDFLGWHIQRRRQKGSARTVVYTYPAKKSLHSILAKVRMITRRSGSPYESLEALLKHLNRSVQGWCVYFRHGVSTATFRYLYHYMWHAVARWLTARHPRLGWRALQHRFLTGYPAHRPTENGTVLYNPQEIAITRYHWRGYTIPTPWTHRATHLTTPTPA